MSVKVGINGFGRIGRNFLRAVRDTGAEVDLVGVNDITDAKTLAHLLKYDSVLGRMDAEVAVSDNGLSIDGDELRVEVDRDVLDARDLLDLLPDRHRAVVAVDRGDCVGDGVGHGSMIPHRGMTSGGQASA